MDKLKLMSAFVAVADEGGFAAGARRLGMSAPAITRAIASLERALGVKLLRRTTRKLALTRPGESYLQDARRILAQVTEAEDAVAGLHTQIRGEIRITAPVLFGKMFVIPVVLDFLRRHPEVDISALLLDRVVDLMDEGVDVGVRIGALPDSSINAIRVGEVHRLLCAAPSYLKKHGVPRSPEDLHAHQLIAATGIGASTEWRFTRGGKIDSIALRPRLTVTSNDAALEAAVAGFGVTRLLSYQVDQELRQGRLKVVLRDHELPPVPINIVHREGRHASTRVRLFIDQLAEALRGNEALQVPAGHGR